MNKLNRNNLNFVNTNLLIKKAVLRHYLLPVLLTLLTVTTSVAQEDDEVIHMRFSGTVVRALIVDGDTFPMVDLETFYVIAKKPVKNKRFSRQYRKLRRDVKRAYPYAKLAGVKLREYDAQLKALKTDRQRHKFMKQVEKELRAEFEDDVTDLTIRQGIILIKLIDRETGDTSYELVKQFRGSFSAFFWQSVARLFGHNLKLDYDPEGEDRLIEEIVILIEKGEI